MAASFVDNAGLTPSWVSHGTGLNNPLLRSAARNPRWPEAVGEVVKKLRPVERASETEAAPIVKSPSTMIGCKRAASRKRTETMENLWIVVFGLIFTLLAVIVTAGHFVLLDEATHAFQEPAAVDDSNARVIVPGESESIVDHQ